MKAYSKLLIKFPCCRRELFLNITLQCGQSFRWRKGTDDKWTGMIKDTVWTLSQDEEYLHCLLHNYDVTEAIKKCSLNNVDKSSNYFLEKNEVPSKRLKINSGTHKLKEERIDPMDNITTLKRCTRKIIKCKDLTTDIKLENSAVRNVECIVYDATNTPDDILSFYKQILSSYFRLDISLEALYSSWSKRDENFAKVAPHFPGIRMLDQPAVENVFSFICSSNNNIVRISQLVEKLCVNFGTAACSVDDFMWHSFPTIEGLCQPGLEEKLRGLGFGYRASYISKSAAMIAANGGDDWLHSLRLLPYDDCHKQLCTLTGVGPKVADCICLMSMNHLSTIPVDTHVFQIAARDYLPELRCVKTVTGKVYNKIATHFRDLYGEYAGWAHSVLFSADLQKFAGNKERSPSKKGRKTVKSS